MKPLRRHVLAVVLGMGMLVALLGLVMLDGLISAEPPDAVIVREVVLRDPPPPPPPPLTRREQPEDPRPELSSARQQLPLELTTMNLNIEIPAGILGGSGFGDLGQGLGVDLGTVDLNDLDGIPTVVRAPVIDDYPETLIEEGIRGFEVVLHILVDEQGRPYLIEVLESAYPPYNARLDDFVSDVRFTPPTLLGVPVRTEYAWPLLIRLP